MSDDAIRARIRPQLLVNTILFLVFFLAFLGKTLLGSGYAVNAEGAIVMEEMKYLHNLIDMWYLALCAFGGRVVGAFWHCTHTFAKELHKRHLANRHWRGVSCNSFVPYSRL